MFLIKNIYITRYQELQKYKQDRKGVINKYSEKIKAPISSLQDTSSSTIESTIHSSSKSITSSNDINSSEMSSFSYASNITSGINSRNVSNGSLIFGIDGSSQKSITSKDTRLTIAISDLIILEGIYFNLSQKPIFKKELNSEMNFSKTYIHPNRKLIPKELLDVIREQNTKINLAIIKKEADIFGLLFLGDGSTISRCPLINILDSGGEIPVSVLEIVYFQGHLSDGNKKTEHSFVINF